MCLFMIRNIKNKVHYTSPTEDYGGSRVNPGSCRILRHKINILLLILELLGVGGKRSIILPLSWATRYKSSKNIELSL